MIHTAKTLATNPSDSTAFENWSDANQKLIEAVAQVREAVSEESNQSSDDSSCTSTASSSIPNLNDLQINGNLIFNFYKLHHQN
jgi:hypothetical protein